MREQVQAKVGVGGVGRCFIKVDLDEDHFLFGATVRVGAVGGDLGRVWVGIFHGAQAVGCDTQRRCREPDVQDSGVTCADVAMVATPKP